MPLDDAEGTRSCGPDQRTILAMCHIDLCEMASVHLLSTTDNSTLDNSPDALDVLKNMSGVTVAENYHIGM